MMRTLSNGVALLLLATAVPALAQSAPPPPGGSPEVRERRMVIKRYGHDGRDDRGPGPMGGTLSGLTPEGRKILTDAMRENRSDGRDAIGDARRKVLELLDADRLDVAAVRRAMAEEHNLVQRKQQERQEAMLTAYQKLSVRDRKAFATSMRAQTYRMEQVRKDAEGRMSRMRERWGREPQASAKD